MKPDLNSGSVDLDLDPSSKLNKIHLGVAAIITAIMMYRKGQPKELMNAVLLILQQELQELRHLCPQAHDVIDMYMDIPSIDSVKAELLEHRYSADIMHSMEEILLSRMSA